MAISPFDWSPYRNQTSSGNAPAMTWDNPAAAMQFINAPSSYERQYNNFLQQQERVSNNKLGAQQNVLQSLLPALFGMIGGVGGGGNYQTDYGAGLYRSPAQQPQQIGGQGMGGGMGGQGMGGGGMLDQILARLQGVR